MLPINTDIAIIGAGTSGSFIASLLNEAGFECILLEKSRGRGGRCSRRQLETGTSIDLGTSEFLVDLAENPQLKKYLDAWVQADYLQPWSYQASRFNQTDQLESITSLCAAPSMNTWHKHIAHHINIISNCKIDSITKLDEYWHLSDQNGLLISTAKNVILTCPAEQAAALLKQETIFLSDERMIRNSLAQFVCAIGFTQPSNIPADVYRGGHGKLATAIRENSKPSRALPNSLQEIWLLHSTHNWALQNGSLGHEQAAATLADEFCQQFNSYISTGSERQILTSHYWRLARHQIEDHSEPPFMWDKTLKIGCCGDWLSTDDIQGALNSALGLFEKITSTDK